MIKFIIGKNASGKTLYLNNCVKQDLNSNEDIEFVTNLKDTNYQDVDYDYRKIEILEEISHADSIDTSNELLALIESPVKLSKEFLQLVTILCKKCKRAYIDEPEQGLSEYEINLLASFLQYTNKFFEEIVVVTHSELLIQVTGCRLLTVKMDEFTTDIQLLEVSEEKKFEIVD